VHTEKTRAPDSAACLHKRRRTRDEWVECQRSWKLVADVAALSIACACERIGIEESATQLFWVAKQERTQKSAGALPLSYFLAISLSHSTNTKCWVRSYLNFLLLFACQTNVPRHCICCYEAAASFLPAFHFAFTFGYSICMLQQLRALR